jgi:hypothetical protein
MLRIKSEQQQNRFAAEPVSACMFAKTVSFGSNTSASEWDELHRGLPVISQDDMFAALFICTPANASRLKQRNT